MADLAQREEHEAPGGIVGSGPAGALREGYMPREVPEVEGQG